jgi:hypothetical protein
VTPDGTFYDDFLATIIMRTTRSFGMQIKEFARRMVRVMHAKRIILHNGITAGVQKYQSSYLQSAA